MQDEHVTLRFDGQDRAEANVLAADLCDFLRERTSVEGQVRRENSQAQDFGATVVLILGTASVQLLAGSIGLWIQRHREASAKLQIGDVSIEMSNVDTKTLSSVLEKALVHAKD